MTRKQGVILRPLDLHKPATEPKRGCRPDRHGTVLASFAVKPNAGLAPSARSAILMLMASDTRAPVL